MTEKELKTYVDYVNSHIKEISKDVDIEFNNQKSKLKRITLKKIKTCLNNAHYEWKMNFEDNPYDYSGVIEENGNISLNQTISQFFENEFTGNRTATYENYHGWNYDTYEKQFSDFSFEIAFNIMRNVIKNCIEKHFNVIISNNNLDDIQMECNCFDDIYSTSMTCDFFSASAFVEFLEIDKIKLKDIV